MISGIDISYRAVEGLYSDGLVMMALRNLHVPLLRGEITRSDAASGRIFIDLGILCVGIGGEAEGNGNEGDDEGKRSVEEGAFAYSFRLMGLKEDVWLLVRA